MSKERIKLKSTEELKSVLGVELYREVMDEVNEIIEPTALVVGNEVSGVSEEAIGLCEACWEIRQFGTKHSMNVAVSGGMAIHHWVHLWRKGNGA